MAVIDSAYNFYLSTYGNSSNRFDSHKKSELRTAYNNIVKVNKESPLYKIKNDDNLQKHVINIKENARSIKHAIASMDENGEDLDSFFNKKVPYSTDEDLVSVDYVGDSGDSSSIDFNIEVKQLASPQVNLGNYLHGSDTDFVPGDYTFDLDTTNSSYEFQYTVNENENNMSVLNKLSRLINSSGIGLQAEIVNSEGEVSALKITSKQTGLAKDENYLFNIQPGATSGSIDAMQTLGIHHITSPAENSKFNLNGVERSSHSNTFTVANAFEVTLNGVSEEGEATSVGLKTSVDAVADNINSLVNAYNGFLKTSEEYTDFDGKRLTSELKSVTGSFKDELESIGLVASEDGYLDIDKALLSQALDSENRNESFSVLNSFKNALSAKADSASVNPLKYVNKLIVEYKNPVRTFAAPYASSIYSGMMVDTFA
ncbi:MAG: flagellar filament capping protein FliD [Lachnospiraceae bacterium]|nr:flagellar filament capping protein FliD [Lachnospiraceae bacterium]